jgi:hypothetical protein
VSRSGREPLGTIASAVSRQAIVTRSEMPTRTDSSTSGATPLSIVVLTSAATV